MHNDLRRLPAVYAVSALAAVSLAGCRHGRNNLETTRVDINQIPTPVYSQGPNTNLPEDNDTLTDSDPSTGTLKKYSSETPWRLIASSPLPPLHLPVR
jgi:hypothetical protein